MRLLAVPSRTVLPALPPLSGLPHGPGSAGEGTLGMGPAAQAAGSTLGACGVMPAGPTLQNFPQDVPKEQGRQGKMLGLGKPPRHAGLQRTPQALGHPAPELLPLSLCFQINPERLSIREG